MKRQVGIIPFERRFNCLLQYSQCTFCETMAIPIWAPCDRNDVNHSSEEDSQHDLKEYAIITGSGNIGKLRYSIKIGKKLIQEGKIVRSYMTKYDYAKINYIDAEFGKSICNYQTKFEEFARSKVQRFAIETQKVPIYAVGSICGENQKAEVALHLTKTLQSKGYKVLCIMNDSIFELFGLTSIHPINIFEGSTNHAVASISQYISSEVRTGRYDAVVLELPEGLLKYDDSFLDGAGIWSYLYTQAVDIRNLICCVPASLNTSEYYYLLGKTIAERYAITNIYFHMSNFMPDERFASGVEKIPGCYLETEEYESIIKKSLILTNGLVDNYLKDDTAWEVEC